MIKSYRHILIVGPLQMMFFVRNGLLDSPHRANSHGEARKTMHPACCRGSRWVGFHHPSVLAVSVEKNNKKQIDHDKTNTEIERQTKNGTCLSKNKLEHKCVDHAGFITPEFLSATFAPNLQRPSSLRWTMMTQMPRLVSIDKHNTYIDTYA